MRNAAMAPVVLLAAGCSAESRPPGPPVPLRSFDLHDVQGLWGGHALWAGEDRTAAVQVVERSPDGLRKKRYTLRLTDTEWAEVERLVGAHHLFTLTIPERTAVPDEAHPIISLVAKDGATARVRKWAKDRHPDFDPVYGYLRGFGRADGEPTHDGPFDWNWRPDGFERPYP